jgi:hypothetical protein
MQSYVSARRLATIVVVSDLIYVRFGPLCGLKALSPEVRELKTDIAYRCGGASAKSLTTAIRASGPTFTVPANG